MNHSIRSIFRRGQRLSWKKHIDFVVNREKRITTMSEKSTPFDRAYFVLPNDTPFCALQCEEAFKNLSDKEKSYSHYLSQASWYGSLIVLHQTSPESPLIFLLLHKLFKHQSLDELKKVALEKAGMSEDDFKSFLIYASGVYYNTGNYKGFGDTKIVPGVEQTKFESLLRQSGAYADDVNFQELLPKVVEKIYSLEEKECRLGLWNNGVTTYHSSNIDEQDIEFVRRYMKSKRLEPWNTRLFKTVEAGKNHYEIRFASVEGGVVSGPEQFEDSQVIVSRGDYSPLLARVIHFLTLAKEHAATDNQLNMIENYIKHFQTGTLDLHKEGSRYWIKDKGPVVESYIGFIENYRDPVGERAEFEGFVAIVNRAMSEKFSRLVENAEKLLTYLPWDRDYEKDHFLRPDFTSLDVLCFGGSGIPVGINIPNYDEIRQDEGFKNVSLGNVMAAVPKMKTTFLTMEDQELYKRYFCESIELQVGLHELLGHGAGKLFYHNRDGTYNFDVDAVKDMETGGKVTSWYEEGETWSTKFGSLCGAYEECRAEAVGYFLSTFRDVLKIFGHDDDKIADDIKYANWLAEHRAGLVSLEFYSPEKKAWGQPHCHARYALLVVAIEAGNGFVEIKEFINEEDGKPDLLFTLDRSKIDSVGKPAVAAFLKKLQLYKSTGDFTKGKAFFDRYSPITEQTLQWRDIVIARRQPRRIFVLPNTILQDGRVTLKTYPETPEGAVESNVERYVDDAITKEMLGLLKKDEQLFVRP